MSWGLAIGAALAAVAIGVAVRKPKKKKAVATAAPEPPAPPPPDIDPPPSIPRPPEGVAPPPGPRLPPSQEGSFSAEAGTEDSPTWAYFDEWLWNGQRWSLVLSTAPRPLTGRSFQGGWVPSQPKKGERLYRWFSWDGSSWVIQGQTVVIG